MPELRKDPIIGRWVIISTERRMRPTDFGASQVKPPKPQDSVICPLCPRNEELTPPEILAYRPAGLLRDKPGWALRVVSNKYPALRIEGDLWKEGIGIYDKMNGIGAHEVIIESPNHEDTLSTIPVSSFRDVLWAYRERIEDLKKDIRFRYVLIFKNHGEAAGASLEHTHSQLIALPIVPQTVRRELEGSRTFYQYRDRCVFCDILQQEQKEEKRVIINSHDFLVITPFASRFPFETWIIPKRHVAAFERATVLEMEDLARVFSETLKCLDHVLQCPPYNFILHTAPFNSHFPLLEESYHWHFEIMPILTKVAGFEWGTGFFINPVPPEEAAPYLKEAYRSLQSETASINRQ